MNGSSDCAFLAATEIRRYGVMCQSVIEQKPSRYPLFRWSGVVEIMVIAYLITPLYNRVRKPARTLLVSPQTTHGFIWNQLRYGRDTQVLCGPLSKENYVQARHEESLNVQAEGDLG